MLVDVPLMPREKEQLLHIALTNLITRTVAALDRAGASHLAGEWDQAKQVLCAITDATRDVIFAENRAALLAQQTLNLARHERRKAELKVVPSDKKA